MENKDKSTLNFNKDILSNSMLALCTIETPPIYQPNSSSYITTKQGVKLSRNAFLSGSDKIFVVPMTIIENNVIIRGELYHQYNTNNTTQQQQQGVGQISIGNYCIICQNAVLKPSLNFNTDSDTIAAIPMTIGEHTIIRESAVVSGAYIGTCCIVGSKSVVGAKCILSDCSILLDNSVLTPNTVVPSYCIFGGKPARLVGRLPPSYLPQQIQFTILYYKQFKARPKKK